MKLSTRGRYGARFMLDLALHFGQGPVMLKDVSFRQEISIKYLEQLVTPLRLAGLVKSTRGPHGGYHLTRAPDEITLCEIVDILEGPQVLSDCLSDEEACSRSSTCVTHEIWGEVNTMVIEKLMSISLQKMAERQRELESSNAAMYYI
ncbi:MAG: Rrf2 family transcriptional regulator [bacterium]|nr:Rrf2 family transcriptional regulator [bacterium]